MRTAAATFSLSIMPRRESPFSKSTVLHTCRGSACTAEPGKLLCRGGAPAAPDVRSCSFLGRLCSSAMTSAIWAAKLPSAGSWTPIAAAATVRRPWSTRAHITFSAQLREAEVSPEPTCVTSTAGLTLQFNQIVMQLHLRATAGPKQVVDQHQIFKERDDAWGWAHLGAADDAAAGEPGQVLPHSVQPRRQAPGLVRASRDA